MFLMSIKPSPRHDQKLKATFCKCETKNACKGSNHKIVHFGGARGGGTETFIDHHDETKRQAYITKHRPKEDWTDPTKASTLNKYLFWWKPTLKEAVAGFKAKFKL